jgi:hypothetical protein
MRLSSRGSLKSLFAAGILVVGFGLNLTGGMASAETLQMTPVGSALATQPVGAATGVPDEQAPDCSEDNINLSLIVGSVSDGVLKWQVVGNSLGGVQSVYLAASQADGPVIDTVTYMNVSSSFNTNVRTHATPAGTYTVIVTASLYTGSYNNCNQEWEFTS